MSRVILFLFLIAAGLRAEEAPALATAEMPKEEKPIAREPFTLRFTVDAAHHYEVKFGKVPYVDKGNVYVFKGDDFGLTLDIVDGKLQGVHYQPDTTKADVTLHFTQEESADEAGMMMLEIRNNTKLMLTMDALMTVPGDKTRVPTTILPIGPGMSNFESWPHPVVQLVLWHLKVSDPAKAALE